MEWNDGCWQSVGVTSKYTGRLAWRAAGSQSDISATVTTTRPPTRSEVSTKRTSCIDVGPGRSFEAVEFAALEWVCCVNNRRFLEPIGSVLPARSRGALLRHAG